MTKTVTYTFEKRLEYWLVHATPKCSLFEGLVVAAIYEPFGPNPTLSFYMPLGADGVQEILDMLKEEKS